MGKHGTNRTANAVYSNAERLKDKTDGQYGTTRQRLGKDSLQEVDACCLTLQPCRDPWVTPAGYLYERSAIIENMVHQKAEIARKMKAWDRQRSKEKREMVELAAAEREDMVKAFKKQSSSVTTDSSDHFHEDQAAVGHATKALQVDRTKWHQVKETKKAETPSFWLPSVTPDAGPAVLKKPSTKTRCPMTNKPLKLKDLIKVHFTVADSQSTQSIITREERYMCPVTRTVFRGNARAVVLRPTGRVVSADCVERIIKKDMVDPISGEPLKPSDLIPLQQGASSFAGSGKALMAESSTAALSVT